MMKSEVFPDLKNPGHFSYMLFNGNKCVYYHPGSYTTKKSAVRGAVNKLKTFRPEEVAPVVEPTPVPVVVIDDIDKTITSKMKVEKKLVPLAPAVPVAPKKVRTMKFNFYHDPSNGWLNVNRDLLVKLGIDVGISDQSFQRKGSVYLDEKKDMSLLMKALRDAGIEPVIAKWATSRTSKIRGYQSYSAE